MQWIDCVSYFFGGALLTNVVPHFVSGVMGRPFQSPFATPRGEGHSSSTVNVLWGFLNLVIGYVLVVRVGDFDLRSDVGCIESIPAFCNLFFTKLRLHYIASRMMWRA